MNKQRIFLATAVSFAIIAGVGIYLVRKPSTPPTVGDVCRDYALAVEDVAKARDDLGRPSWEELVEKHPALVRTEKNARAITLAKSVSVRLLGANDTPAKLKVLFYDQCLMNYLCIQDGICN